MFRALAVYLQSPRPTLNSLVRRNIYSKDVTADTSKNSLLLNFCAPSNICYKFTADVVVQLDRF